MKALLRIILFEMLNVRPVNDISIKIFFQISFAWTDCEAEFRAELIGSSPKFELEIRCGGQFLSLKFLRRLTVTLLRGGRIMQRIVQQLV